MTAEPLELRMTAEPLDMRMTAEPLDKRMTAEQLNMIVCSALSPVHRDTDNEDAY